MPVARPKVKPRNRLRGGSEAAIFGPVLGHCLLIVSDAHLGREPSRTEEAFLAFLDAAPDLGDCLLVNGDLFEFWFSYRRVVPRAGFKAAAALANLRRHMPVVMTGGNHDRWGGSFWEQELGIGFQPDEIRVRIGSREVLALHGDGISDGRWTSRLLRRLTSQRFLTGGFGALHPDLGHRVVDRLSAYLGNTERDPAILAESARKQQQWAERRLAADPGLGAIVMGHTHRAALTEPAPGRHYLNPGAWFDGYRYAILSDEATSFAQFTG